jgi:UDP-2,3-diacylglucosamine hydrolase
MTRAAPARLAERPLSGAAHASAGRIGILAGGGRLPLMIAEGVLAGGGQVHIVAIEGEADPGIGRFAHTWVNWGQVGRMVSTLRTEADALVIAGAVRRPDLWKLRPDLGFFLSLPRIVEMLAGGDDSVLSRVVRFFEAKGIAVRGAHEVAPDLLALAGPAGALSLDRQAQADAELGFAVRAALGPLDAGQAVVIADGKVLAIEGAEGTDAMLARVAGLRAEHTDAAGNGVLAKGPKPGQELRVDMPAIGPRTVEAAARAGLAGLAIEAGAVLLLDRDAAVLVANSTGIAVEGLRSTPISPFQAAHAGSSAAKEPADVEQGARHGVPSPLAGEGQGGGDSRTLRPEVPHTPNPSPQAGGESGRGRGRRRRDERMRPSHPLRVVGRLRPNDSARTDIEKGFAAIECLAPFQTGHAVVVTRAYVLAIAAEESTSAMLERTRALRQWGVGARRRIGALACRAAASEGSAGHAAALLDQAAAAGLAGVAVTGTPEVLAAFESAGEVADRHGLFLVVRGEQT